jgi:pimeloyl-ACP methyl ester carboxylesterase
LATQGRTVSGVAADGVAEIVIRIPASQLGQTFTLAVETEPKDDGVTQPSTSVAEDGGLAATGPAPNFQSSVTVSAVATSSGQYYAFAVYRAPLDFIRAGNTYDTAQAHKQIVIMSETGPVPVSIIRPPVFLIHGIWGQPEDFAAFVSGFKTDGRFYYSTADYSSTNDQGVESNEIVVLAQLRQVLSAMAAMDDIAVVQADVVGHSMGGLIARAMPLDSNFYLETNYVRGLIHKLITIDTPHGGSQLAANLSQSNIVCKAGFAWNGHGVDGGVDDLVPGSALLTSLGGSTQLGSLAPPLLAHAIVGVASSQQETNNENAIDGEHVSFWCPSLIKGGFEQIFGGSSDLIVSAPSQEFGFPSSAVTTSNGVIHAVVQGFFPDGPDALDEVLSAQNLVASQNAINFPIVVNLLNTVVSDPSFASVKP